MANWPLPAPAVDAKRLLRMSLKPTKAKRKRVEESERRLRTFALHFPEVREDHPWGHSAFKVKGKTFLFMATEAASCRCQSSCRHRATTR